MSAADDVAAWSYYYAPEPLKTKIEKVLACVEAAQEVAKDETDETGDEFVVAYAKLKAALAALDGEQT